MIRSMTGFGAGVADADGVRASVEVRAVNHRYLRIFAHFPDAFGRLQHETEEVLRKRYGRGSYNVTVRIEHTGLRETSLIDRSRLERVLAELRAARAELDPGEASDGREIDIVPLLALPGVVREGEDELVEQEHARVAIERACAIALEKLDEMKCREGAHLAETVGETVTRLASALDTIAERLPAIGREGRERYRRRLQEFLDGTGVDVDPSDVVREAAVLAEKADVAEEVERLHGHIDQYREALEAGGRVGRKLDFLAQEMFREANTMAAKVHGPELAREVVEMKADVDRLREQSQNIE